MNAQSSKTEQGSSLDSMHNSARTDSPEDIEQQAADWLLRLDTDQGPSQAELKRLRAWVERSPAHREQFKRLTQYWHCTTLPADLSFSPANSSESEATKATSVSAFQRLFSRGWRGTAIMGTALSLTAALAMGLLIDNSSGISGNGIYETRTG